MRAVVEEAGLDALPILAGLDFGHTDPTCTLPYGALAEVDVDALTFSILEPGVHEPDPAAPPACGGAACGGPSTQVDHARGPALAVGRPAVGLDVVPPLPG